MKDFVFVFCWLGVAQSALLGFYFLTKRKDRHAFLLGLILLMIGLRATKSILYLTYPDLPPWMINMGFAAHAMIAPLSFLYLLMMAGQRSSYLIKSIHFIPPIVILSLSPFLTLPGFWYKGGYSALLFYTLIYLGSCWWLYYRYNKTALVARPILVLLLGISLFQLSYFTNYILRLTPYEAGPVIHSIIIYAISFTVLKTKGAFAQVKKKYSNLNIAGFDLKNYEQKIITVMRSNHPYLNPDFSLTRLSELTGIQMHILSYVFTESIKQNFQFFTNTYRVEQAKRLLKDTTKKHLSIAAVADECGFHTLSSFNAAFKKVTSLTPSEFRNKRCVVD